MPPCIAVRRSSGTIGAPAVVFTFTERTQHPDGALVAVGVGIDGSTMPDSDVTLALSAHERPGDVSWEECERTFRNVFPDLHNRADAAVMARLRDRAATERDRRTRVAAQLRAEVEAYRADRIRELEREEAAEREGTRDQADLFRESRTDWAARRAAVSTQADVRLARVAEWEAVADPPPPELLSILLVFPGGGA